VTFALQAADPRERVRIVTPFGIRFWDPALETQVSDSLRVVAYPDRYPSQGTPAQPTGSGVYAFHHLPGLAAREYPVEPAPSPSPQRRFTIRVSDPRGRFLPVAFEEDLPSPGIYPTNLLCASPSLPPPGFYLFSAPARETPASLAVVRAQLEDDSGASPAPAAFAVVEVEAPGPTRHYGLADERGCVLVLFPYPSFDLAPGAAASPPPPGPLHWPVQIRLRWQPEALRFPAGGATPDLRSVLCQGPASPVLAAASPPAAQLDVDLVFGEALVLKDPGLSTLRIVPAAGSP
jgi:hypothetical protein